MKVVAWLDGVVQSLLTPLFTSISFNTFARKPSVAVYRYQFGRTWPTLLAGLSNLCEIKTGTRRCITHPEELLFEG